MDPNESKPFYDSKFMFSKIMNQNIKRACRKRLEVLLQDEEHSFARWQDVTRRLLNATRARQVERNFYKRINALKIVCCILTDYSDRTGDLPAMVTVRNRTPKKEPRQLPAPPQVVPMLSQDNLNMLVNLAKLLNTKNS